ncbi:uncharacterized protein LOC144005902 isoform X4 [Festucalex cinctus]
MLMVALLSLIRGGHFASCCGLKMTSEFPGWFSSLSERRLTAARKQAVAANETLWSKILQQQSEKDPGNTRVPLFQQRLIASRFHKRNKDLLCAGRLGRKPSHAVMASRVTICHPVVNPHLLSAPPPSGPQETIRSHFNRTAPRLKLSLKEKKKNTTRKEAGALK